jgi:hypothetical protein
MIHGALGWPLTRYEDQLVAGSVADVAIMTILAIDFV